MDEMAIRMIAAARQIQQEADKMGMGRPNKVTDEMLHYEILNMATQCAEVIRNVSILLHVQGKMPDDVFHRMIDSANQIREDALKLERGRE